MSKYTIGRSYEYKAKKELERQGYTVLRASGSHGPWDLIAINEKNPKELIRCIQIKQTKTEQGLKRLFRAYKPFIGPRAACYTVELWIWYKGQWYI